MDEDVGTVELCVIHGGGENVPPVLDATFSGHEYSKFFFLYCSIHIIGHNR